MFCKKGGGAAQVKYFSIFYLFFWGPGRVGGPESNKNKKNCDQKMRTDNKLHLCYILLGLFHFSSNSVICTRQEIITYSLTTICNDIMNLL